MTIIDRYLLRQFFRVFAMVFTSLLGIYVIADFVGNLAEFLDYGKETTSLGQVLAGYYGARVPWFFELAGRNVALLAAVLAIGWMQRDNELTALMAAGISRWRIAKPLLGATCLVAIGGIFNRELAVPAFRSQLCRNAQDLMRNRPDPITPRYDAVSGILLAGSAILPREQVIDQPHFTLPHLWEGVGRKVAGQKAQFLPPGAAHPAGYLLSGVVSERPLAELSAYQVRGRPTVLTPRDQPWLGADQLFVVSDLSVEQLRRGRHWRQCTSTLGLIRGLRGGRLDRTPDVEVMVHARFVQPILDVTLVFLGLPLVLGSAQRQVVLSGAKSLVAIIGCGVLLVVAHGLGIQAVISPSLAAWLPLLVLIPLAFVASQPLRT